MAHLTVGMLVEVVGLPSIATPVPEAQAIKHVGLNGTKAQLVEFDRDSSKWTAASFSGDMVIVDQAYIRPLTAEELQDYDFVCGPMSDFELMGSQLAGVLSTKGYAVMKVFIPQEDSAEIVAAAKRLEEDGQFSRLAFELECGYLGKEGSAKTLLLDPASDKAPAWIRDSPLKMVDHTFGDVCQMLSHHTQEFLGFDIHSRTNMLLRMPLVDGDEGKYPPVDINDCEAEGYLHTMARKRLTLLHFIGPAKGSVTLHPVKEGGAEIELKAEPHTMLLVVANRYEFSHEAAGESLALTTFFLAEPATYKICGEVKGDLEVLTSSIDVGPPPPPGEQCTVDAMHCRFGTGADGKFQFWSSVGKAATDGVTEISLARWDHSPYYDPDVSYGYKSYTRHGCFGIDGVDLFDSKFFEISRAEASGMDPCQRQAMEVSYMSLMEGGWDKRALARESQNIGHFVGIDKDDWLFMSHSVNASGALSAAAAANAIIANRFSYSLNLKGASMTIDTACSSALTCTHVSKLHLRHHDFDPMPASIVNGLNLLLFPGPYVGCCAAGMLSHEGRCFTFNATADGYARGELCGSMLFKIKEYVDDGKAIACLAGSNLSQDGRSASMTVSSGPAQEGCIAAALRECRLTPAEVDCFECHGLGTPLGDPIEVGSLRKLVGRTPRREPLVITGSKPNIAHGEGGAGIAGLSKCVLQVMHCEGSPNLHLRIKNPHLDVEGFPCQVPSETLPIREESAYSGVSAFGFGGTNAHAEAWGKNIMTSRGTAGQDYITAFRRRLFRAPRAEVTINGGDISEWETTGLDPRAEPGSRWKISLDEDGVAEWERDDGGVPEVGDKFAVQGSHNGWSADAFDRHDTIPGLWVSSITVGPTGEEHFQIIADGNREKVYHPGKPRCTWKAAKIEGPSVASQEMSWLIRGAPGETYTVEFFQQNKYLSVTWLKA